MRSRRSLIRREALAEAGRRPGAYTYPLGRAISGQHRPSDEGDFSATRAIVSLQTHCGFSFLRALVIGSRSIGVRPPSAGWIEVSRINRSGLLPSGLQVLIELGDRVCLWLPCCHSPLKASSSDRYGRTGWGADAHCPSSPVVNPPFRQGSNKGDYWSLKPSPNSPSCLPPKRTAPSRRGPSR